MHMTALLAALSTTIAFLATAAVAADNITYRKHIRPLWEQKCMGCHGPTSPYLAEFKANKAKFKKLSRGPRMDSYPALVMFVGWPDTGAVMRRLDDGKSAKNGKPGNMYQYLGGGEAERQKNLALFKSWVGEGGWFRGRLKDLDKATLMKMKVAE